MHVDGSVEHQGAHVAYNADPEIIIDDLTSVPAIEVADEENGTLVAIAQDPPAGEQPFTFAEDDNHPSDFVPQVQADNDPTVVTYEIADDNQQTSVEEFRPPGATPDSPDLSDIARFGNSENARTADGSLRYTVFVTGIDTADVREAFREAITDRKLVWDIDQILRSLKNGEVAIENVTPPKAYILITRLRNLPVNVRWEQYAISQT
jgi:hypothetical protein